MMDDDDDDDDDDVTSYLSQCKFCPIFSNFFEKKIKRSKNDVSNARWISQGVLPACALFALCLFSAWRLVVLSRALLVHCFCSSCSLLVLFLRFPCDYIIRI